MWKYRGLTREVDGPVRSEPNPTVARRELAARLRQAREQHRLGLDDLARLLGVSSGQASRLDAGQRGFRVEDVQKLGESYALLDRDLARLLELADESRRRAWWQKIDLHDAYRTLIGYEQSAVSISEYGPSIVPGLLQVPAYAEEVVRQSELVSPGHDLVRTTVEVRMRRQALLTRTDAPSLHTIIDEVALARGPRDRGVKRAQIEHLLVASEQRRIVIQVIGFEYGLHPGYRGNFIIVSMRPPVPDLVYSEGSIEPSIADADVELDQHQKRWAGLMAVALDPDASRARIKKYLV
jgi:transcriptional regulator with XRE-family HTH domain